MNNAISLFIVNLFFVFFIIEISVLLILFSFNLAEEIEGITADDYLATVT